MHLCCSWLTTHCITARTADPVNSWLQDFQKVADQFAVQVKAVKEKEKMELCTYGKVQKVDVHAGAGGQGCNR